MYCLITGGGMVNKGAQSMTFILMNELKKRFPNDELVLLVPDDSDGSEDNEYAIKYHTAHIKSIFFLLGGAFRCAASLKKVDREDAADLDKLMKNSRLLVDISGYALGSNWADGIVRFYLCMLDLAHRYHVPSYVMPQSFGPFSWHFPKSVFFNWYVRRVMFYPEVVYAREADGLEQMQNKYRLKNVRPSYDMVLLSKGVNAHHIFRDSWRPQEISVDMHSVAIIPNVRLLDRVSKEKVLGYYERMANLLVNMQKRIYVMFHSGEDKLFAQEISDRLTTKGIPNVFLSIDLNCIEYELLVLKFEFIISSRYHSIVHASRQGVPCIALGWAVKYQELLTALGQLQYAFDIQSLDVEKLLSAVQSMCVQWQKEKKTILECVQRIQRTDIFAVLGTE